MKIWIGLIEIGGYYKNLKQGFDEIGVESVFWNLIHHPFQYEAASATNPLVRITATMNTRRLETPRAKLVAKLFYTFITGFLKLFLLIWAIFRYDTFIFGFNSTFLAFYDLPLLKLLGKKIIFVFHGSDARPPYMDGAVITAKEEGNVERCIALTQRQKRRLRMIERYADILVSHPHFGHFHERPFVNFLYVGLPYNLQAASVPQTEGTSGITRILHAPSHPEAKGTTKIRQVIDKLRARGYAIEYVEIAGKPNNEVIRELSRCDFVIDQLYSDTPMAGFAAEAAFMGKPAIVGGYGLKELSELLDQKLIPPSHICQPDELEDAVERLITDIPYRLKLGQNAHTFVTTNWVPRIVAERYIQLLTAQSLADLTFDPGTIDYVYGACISDLRLKSIVQRMIEAGGIQALQIQDKPALEASLLKFVES